MTKLFTFLLIGVLSIPFVAFSQNLYHKDNGANIDQKFADALRYEGYILTDSAKADMAIEVFFAGGYSFIKRGFSGYYKLYDKAGNEVYKSKEIKSGGYGGVAENYMVKKFIKDLPDALKEAEVN